MPPIDTEKTKTIVPATPPVAQEEKDEFLYRKPFLYAIACFNIIVPAAYLPYNWQHGDISVNIAFFVSSAIILTLTYYKKYEIAAMVLIAVSIAYEVVGLTLPTLPDNLRAYDPLFYPVFIMEAFFLLGKKKGLWGASGLLLSLMVVMALNKTNPHLDPAFFSTLLVVNFCTLVIIFFYQKTIEHGQKIITAQKQDLAEHTLELERMNKLMINRELKMVELKDEITALKEQYQEK